MDEAPEMKGWKPLPCGVVTEGKDATLGTQKTQKANEGRLRISEDLEIPLSVVVQGPKGRRYSEITWLQVRKNVPSLGRGKQQHGWICQAAGPPSEARSGTLAGGVGARFTKSSPRDPFISERLCCQVQQEFKQPHPFANCYLRENGNR